MNSKWILTIVSAFLTLSLLGQFQQVNIGQAVINYIEKGTGDPVIFIHGGLEDYRTFEPQLDTFSKNYRAITYSRRYNFPNENKSILPNYSAETEADDLAAMITALNLGPVHVVGHSFGGLTAAVFAKKYPALTRTLTLSEPAFLSWLENFSDGRDEYEKFVNQLVRPLQIAFDLRDTASVLRHTFNYFVGEDISAQLPMEARKAIVDNLGEWKAVMTTPGAFTPLTPDDIKALPMPVMIITGENTLPLLKPINAELVRIMPNAKHYNIPDGTHEIWFTHPQVAGTAVLEFISLYK